MNEQVIKIATFPDDDQKRVVWWYGATYLARTSNPDVEVALRVVNPDGTLAELASIHRVAVTDLCVVRLGSIWVGQIYNGGHLENTESSTFEFDLTLDRGKIINSFEVDNSFSGGLTHFIPRDVHSLSCIPKIMPSPRYDLHFLNSKLTVLKSKNGKKVVIPCLEILTSIYTPQEMDIRRQLFTKTIDSLVEQYVDKKHCEERDNQYHVFMRTPKAPSNITFLSYLTLNKTTRSEVSSIFSELQVQDKSRYSQRYPAARPWQPDKLTIKVDGIWMKNKKSFLVLRINGYSLPNDKAIVENIYQNVVEESEAKASQTSYVPSNQTVSSSLTITNMYDPGTQSGSAYISSDVDIIGELPPIKRNIIASPAGKTKRMFASSDAAIQLSSGEAYGGAESKGTAKLTHREKTTLPSTSNRQHIDQTQVIYIVKEALESLKKDGHIISELRYIDEYGRYYKQFIIGRFPSSLIGSRGINYWPLNQQGSLRGFLLVKVTLNTGRSFYLFEIERKSKNEGFSGVLFRTDAVDLSPVWLSNFLMVTALNKGRFRKRRARGKMDDLELPINEYRIYDHSLIDGTMEKKILKVIKEIL